MVGERGRDIRDGRTVLVRVSESKIFVFKVERGARYRGGARIPVYIIYIYKPVVGCQTLEEQWQRVVMRRRSSATRNKGVVDMADATTLSATTLLFGIPLFYETVRVAVLVLRR